MFVHDAQVAGWIALRAVYAWMFLYPAVGLIRDWPGTVQTTGLVYTRATPVFAAGGLFVMIAGGLMILLGVYGQWAGLALVAFNLGGARIHYRLAAVAQETQVSTAATPEDRATAGQLTTLAGVGHVTSAQKNYVLAAVGLFFALVGTGPMSLVPAEGIFSP